MPRFLPLFPVNNYDRAAAGMAQHVIYVMETVSFGGSRKLQKSTIDGGYGSYSVDWQPWTGLRPFSVAIDYPQALDPVPARDASLSL